MFKILQKYFQNFSKKIKIFVSYKFFRKIIFRFLKILIISDEMIGNVIDMY